MFCIECEKDIKGEKKKSKKKLKIHGVEIEVELEKYYCEKCGEIVFDEELEEINSKKVRDEYCRVTNIISNEQIVSDILQKYSIGAASLAKLLGWGESTIQRYVSGALPKMEYGRELAKLVNPFNMEKLLCENKDNISKRVFNVVSYKINEAYAYESRLKGNTILDAEDLVKHLLNKCDMDSYSPTKAWCLKMIAIIQFWHLYFMETPLYQESIYAWTYGPVVKEAYYSMSEWNLNNLPSDKYLEDAKGTIINLSEEQEKLINAIIKYYGQYQVSKLITITHDTLFDEYYVEGNFNIEIPKWRIKEYYDQLGNMAKVKSYEDIQKIVDIMN